MKRLALIILFFAPVFLSHSQNVVIKGVAKTYANKEIGVWVANDYISNTEKQITYSTIDSVGDFLLEFKSKEMQKITLKIEKKITSMFIEPNGNYEIIILPKDSTTYHNPNIEEDITVSIKLKSKTEINALTMDYDKRFDAFLTHDYPAFVARNPLPKIDSFKLAMHTYYSSVSNSYFDAYITYTIGSLEGKVNHNEKIMFANYIDKKPVLYNNPEYMNFFTTFFKQKIQNVGLSREGAGINFEINERGSFNGAMAILKKDKILQNDTICELVLLKGLYDSYYDGSFKKKNIVPMLEQIIAESKIIQHQIIAQNILNSFSKLKVGASAPSFVLPDKNGVTHSLDELRTKKYVYIQFFDPSCSSCLEQMKVVPSLKKQYGERIEFVSISLEKTNADFKNFSAKNPKYDWMFLYDNTNGQLKNQYEIKSLPTYFLISPEGKFIQVPAESPDSDIDRALYDIAKPKGKRHQIGDKTN
jgi:thiol-disulfide isomerase/thioredoxin